jgi:protoporphyrin/coproporphyrin ferrochelatase
VVSEVKRDKVDKVILLPLYPHYSTSTTSSSIKKWFAESKKQKMFLPTKSICCYSGNEGFISSHCELIKTSLKGKDLSKYRILFSAHGLPKKLINQGDPYQWHIENSVRHIVARLAYVNLDYQICYQSKVGRLEWLTPSTKAEISRAARDKKSVVIVPISFVSENSETLVELDMHLMQGRRELKII